MTLNASGPLSIGGSTVGESINLELGRSVNAQSSLNESALRNLAGVASGQISISNFYGKTYLGAWTSVTGLPGASYLNMGAGTQSAALSFGGTGSLSGGPGATTFSYNGSSWTTSGALASAVLVGAGFGSQSAALQAGGEGPAINGFSGVTQIYNGSTWTNTGNNILQGRKSCFGVGTTTAGLIFGGAAGSNLSSAEKYNGTAWSSAGNLTVARSELGGAGIQSAAVAMGGNTSTSVATTDKYDGSTWTASGNMLIVNRAMACAGANSSSAVIAGGRQNNSDVELFNGSSWTAAANLLSPRQQAAGCGLRTAALVMGGSASSTVVSTVTAFNY